MTGPQRASRETPVFSHTTVTPKEEQWSILQQAQPAEARDGSRSL